MFFVLSFKVRWEKNRRFKKIKIFDLFFLLRKFFDSLFIDLCASACVCVSLVI